MAVSASNLTSGNQTDGSYTSAATSSISPTANNLLLLTVASRTGISTDPLQPTASGNGLTWVVVNSIVYDTASSSRRRITVFRAMGASPSTGAITIDFGGQAQTDVAWGVDQFSGIDTSGTNGSGAIVQSATNKDESITSSSFVVTLAAFSSVDNATFGAYSESDGAHTITVGSGFTELFIQRNFGVNNQLLLETEFKDTNDTSVDWTSSGTVQAGGIAVEIKAASTATGNFFAFFRP